MRLTANTSNGSYKLLTNEVTHWQISILTAEALDARRQADPKSTSFMWPVRSIRTFSGLISLQNISQQNDIFKEPYKAPHHNKNDSNDSNLTHSRDRHRTEPKPNTPNSNPILRPFQTEPNEPRVWQPNPNRTVTTTEQNRTQTFVVRFDSHVRWKCWFAVRLQNSNCFYECGRHTLWTGIVYVAACHRHPSC